MTNSATLDFSDALEWLAARVGRPTLVVVSGPVEDDSPVLLRVEGSLGSMTTIDEGSALSNKVVGTASYQVGAASISMYGPEFTRAETEATLGDWLIVHQRFAVFEWRVHPFST